MKYVLVLACFASAGSALATTIFVGDGGSFLLNTFDGSGNLVNSASPAGGFDFPAGIAIAPNGNVFVVNQSAGALGEVYEFDATGALIGSFVPFGGGGLVIPTGAAFGPDGNLYVADSQNGFVDEFNGSTGSFIAQVIPGTLNGPEGMTFGPDGNLYIADGSGVERWNGSTLSLLTSGTFGAQDVAFGPDGNLYLTDSTASEIRVINSAGADIRDFGFANLDQPVGLAFGPDGKLYVTDGFGVHVFDPGTGNFLEDLVTFNGTTVINSQFIGIPTPEPATFAFGILGIGAMALWGRMRSRNKAKPAGNRVRKLFRPRVNEFV